MILGKTKFSIYNKNNFVKYCFLAMIEKTTLRNGILDEVLKAFGLQPNGLSRRLLKPFFGPPSNRFAEIGVEFDNNTSLHGFCQASKALLPRFIQDMQVHGFEYIPKSGPLLVVSNHPGAYDSLVISSQISRQDYKIVVGNIQFLRLLPNASQHMIFSHPVTEAQARATVVRSSIRHLRDGGALLIFPSGQVDPDPAVMPGALQALANWSRSIALMLKAVPQANLLMAFVSGVLEKRYAYNPLTRLRKDAMEQRRLAEFMQVMKQLVFGGNRIPNTQLSFAPPIKAELLNNLRDTRTLMEEIKTRATDSMIEHIDHWKTKLHGYLGDIRFSDQ